MKLFSGKLWKNRNFNYLWAGMTVSSFGTEITYVALPTVAILMLGAGAMEVGFLKAAEVIAFPLLGLFAGVMTDRFNPKNIMIVSDLSRFLLFLIIPIVSIAGFLNIYILIAVAAITGAFTVFFNVSYMVYITAVVKRENLIEGNSKLSLTQSAAQVSGPVITGWLIIIMGAAKSIIFDALSYLLSAWALIMIKPEKKEIQKAVTKSNKSIWIDIKEGLQFVFSNKTLRTLMLSTGLFNLGFSIVQPMLFVFAYKELKINPGVMGIILAVGSSGLLLGTAIAPYFTKKLDLGRSMFFSVLITGIAGMLIPVAKMGFPEIVLTLCWFLLGVGTPIYDINQFTLRQLLTPDELLGRMNATMRIIIMGVMPVGAVLGGVIASLINVRVAIVVGGAAYVASSIVVLTSHLFSIREQPLKNKPDEAESGNP